MMVKRRFRPFVLLFILFIALLLRTSSVSTARSGDSDKALIGTYKNMAGAQSPTLDNAPILEYVGHFGGTIIAVDVQDNYAFVGEGPRVTILDITDPTGPSVVGKTAPMPEIVQEIVASGNHAYVAAGKAGLRIFDLSIPASPVEISALDAVGDVRDIAVEGDYLYAADFARGLRIIDISDLQKPTEVGFFSVTNYTKDVAISGNRVLLANGPVRIIDVSDVSTPVEVGEFASHGDAQGVAIRGNYAYIADGEGGLRIVDIANVEAPIEVGFFKTSGPSKDLSLSGSYAYMADSFYGLRIIDISVPEEPKEIAFYNADGYAYDVIAAVDSAYVAFERGGLHIINVENAEAPSAVGFYKPLGQAFDVAGAGNFAVVASGYDGLVIIDLANPSKPAKISSSPGYATGVAVQEDYAYVVSSRGLRIVDISDPFNPIEASFIETQGDTGAVDVSVAGSFAYVGASLEGLIILDVSDPRKPVEVGRFEGLAGRVALSEDYAFVTASHFGTQIIDITNPAEPFLVERHGVFDTSPLDVDVCGNYMYIAYGEDWGLEIVNISNPAEPVRVTFYNPSWTVSRVVVQDGLAFVPADGFGLKMINVSEPDNPHEVAHFDTSGSGWSVALNGNYAYVADGPGGFYILRTNNVDDEPPKADFSASPTSGVPSLGVEFTNLSTGDFDECQWDFGDKGTSGVCDGLSHTYNQGGTFSVSLTVKGPGGEDTITKTDYITVYEPVKADFRVSPTSGVPPLEVFFENLSTGDYDTCEWDFGGGLGSEVCVDPSVIYTEEGSHTVSLTVKGPGGEDTKTMGQYVKVGYQRIFLPGVMGKE